MKIRSNIAAAFAAVVITASAFAAEAASPAGNWKWTQQGGRGGAQDLTAKLEVKDGKLTGTVTNAQGDAPISEATFKDGTVAFSVERTFGENKFVTKYSGKLEGDTIKGTLERPGRGGGAPTSTEWTATRVK
jgi:hypothetical protein